MTVDGYREVDLVQTLLTLRLGGLAVGTEEVTVEFAKDKPGSAPTIFVPDVGSQSILRMASPGVYVRQIYLVVAAFSQSARA